MTGLALARAAQSLIGIPFRLHGRDPATGLDCVGLLDAAMRLNGRHPALPNGYTLRSLRCDGAETIAATCGFVPARGSSGPGDVLLVRSAPCQFHLLISATTPGAFVHAHAGLRRVVLGQIRADWPVTSHWRLADAT